MHDRSYVILANNFLLDENSRNVIKKLIFVLLNRKQKVAFFCLKRE